MLLFAFLPLILAYPQAISQAQEHANALEAKDTCPNYPVFGNIDISVKSRDIDLDKCPQTNIFRRAPVADDDYTCSETKPCKNGACCPKATGYCNYGPQYCGTNGQSPNDVCWSNCDAHPECGRFAIPANKTCPLNVCCSQYGYCGTTSDFCTTLCQSNCNQPKSGGSGGNVQQRIIGYYESWQADRSCIGMNYQGIPVESLTHLNYAFAYITPGSFQVAPMPGVDASTFAQFTAIKSRNRALKAFISIGGWTFNDNNTNTQAVYTTIVSSPANRQTFISNLLSFMDQYGFDGVDFDWEYPGAPDRGGHPNDGINYTQFLKELQAAISSSGAAYEVSFTAPTSYWYLRWFDITNMMKYVTFMNFMAYDLHGVWDASDPIGAVVLAHTNLTEISDALDLLWRNKIPAKSVNLGLGFYGRSFTLQNPGCWQPGCPFSGGASPGGCTRNSGTLSYREIMDIVSTYSLTPYWDKTAGVKYVTWNQNQWVSYDDQDTFQQKIKFANQQGLGGLLIWSVDQDTADLAALRGVVYPKALNAFNSQAEDASYWQESSQGDCGVTDCGGSCGPGTVTITHQPCGNGQKSALCCPIAAAPNPADCEWHGSAPLCDGQCDPGEVALESNKWGDGHYCNDGRKFYCCKIPEAKSIDCSWQGQCTGTDVAMTFKGTFLETLADISIFFGLEGLALSAALSLFDIQDLQMFCCSAEEAARWKNCYWAGTVGKGFYSCDDNHCATGHEVELTKSDYGEGQSCFPQLSRSRAFCCDTANGQSPFLPVPLEFLFPNPPNEDTADPVFNLETDDTWGTGHVEGQDDPNDAAFGFVVITSPAEVQVSLDKRDGSDWELFDCVDAVSEEAQTIRMICTNNSPSSNCHKIYLGHGVPGTILDMPNGCGPGKYAVAKSMEPSANQSLPHHLSKRNLGGQIIYDLTFDYDFTRVPRDMGDSQMRIDFSNEEGYWDNIVDKAGETKRKRSLKEVGSHKRWLEEEWRDDLHFGALSHEDLHKRWFGSGIVQWLTNLVTTGSATVTEQFNHQVDETITAIICQEQWGPCPIGNNAAAQANVKAEVQAHLQMATSFGMTIITTLTLPPQLLDLSNSYLYFKNKGSVTATFSLDAAASVAYSSGDIKMIGLDDFPGATFRVPGIVTIGPNLAVYGSINAELVVSGHLKSQVNLAKWEVQQVYPQASGFAPKDLTPVDADGTGTLGKPTFDWSVEAIGQVQLHIKPTITFGIVFDRRWNVPNCAAMMVADGYITFHASGQAGNGGQSQCPFTYGIDAGVNLYAQLQAPTLFGWGGNSQYPLASIGPRQITAGGSCPAQQVSSKRDYLILDKPWDDSAIPDVIYRSDSLADFDMLPTMSGISNGLSKRDSIVVGPLVRIPPQFLKCPGSGGVSNTTGSPCPLCGTVDDGTVNSKRDGESCPFVGYGPDGSDAVCLNSNPSRLVKRTNTDKTWTLSWLGTQLFSVYPSCSASSPPNVPKWYLPLNSQSQTCTPAIQKASRSGNTVGGLPISRNFQTDHVFDIQIFSQFFEWLCAGGRPTQYQNLGPIPFPAGWTRPSQAWCDDYLGADNAKTGWTFSFDNTGQGDVVTWAQSYLGNTYALEALALLQTDLNRLKGVWMGGGLPNPRQGTGTQLDNTRNMRNNAAVFQYMQFTGIRDAFMQAGNRIEAICASFDGTYPYNTPVAGVFQGPARPAGVTTWGLRTLWCYWIDNHLNKIEQLIAGTPNQQGWIDMWRNTMQQFWPPSGSTNVMSDYLAAQVIPPTGLGNVANMHFYRPNPQAPIPGQNSRTSLSSRYGMWGGDPNLSTQGANAFGPLGL